MTNDEHVPWIAVDLDATLAKYDGWKGPNHIGDPIPLMVQRVIQWKKKGTCVKIMTARACSTNPNRESNLKTIEDWLELHVYPELKHWDDSSDWYKIPITSEKDFDMIELWDDRAVQVKPNTGKRVDGKD